MSHSGLIQCVNSYLGQMRSWDGHCDAAHGCTFGGRETAKQLLKFPLLWKHGYASVSGGRFAS